MTFTWSTGTSATVATFSLNVPSLKSVVVFLTSAEMTVRTGFGAGVADGGLTAVQITGTVEVSW